VPPAAAASAAPGADYAAETQAVLEETALARDRFYASLGAVDADVLASLINPAFRGGPRWPALRQAWSTIRRPDSTLVASNGLSDPFEEDGQPPVPLGHRIEVYAEAAGRIKEVGGSWLFDLVFQVSQNVAAHGQFVQSLERYGVLTMLLQVEGVPSDWVSGENGVAVLIGQAQPESFPTPYGDVRMVALTLLRPEELAFIEKDGDISGNRVKLAALFAGIPDGHVNDFDRAAIVAG
jgi:hypothetical protein